MMKNTLKTLGFTTLLLLSLENRALAFEKFVYGDFEIVRELSTELEIESSEGAIPVFKTGLEMNLENPHGLSANFIGGIDDKIDEIDSRDFELGKFIRELNANYQIETKDTVLLFSVGKMPSGVKVDNDDIREDSGVMGVRLSIKPEKIPLIQDWLTKHKFKINRIDILRYNSGSKERLDLRDLSETKMTSYALFLSKGHNIQTFFVYKRPDTDNTYGVTSKSLGAVYMMEGELKPQFFVMKHKSKASFMELDLMIVSASIELAPTVRSTFSYSHATEEVSETKKDTYDFYVTKSLKDTKKLSIDLSTGVRSERENTHTNNVIYMRLEAKY